MSLSDLSHFRGFGGPPAAPGVVHLVGSGPGDLGLLTLRAAVLLSTCDVVAYDRLAPSGALELVPEHAERICVGRRSGEEGLSRAAVDELLRTRARDGKAVVRLKGGDPFVFGRGGEEAEACAAEGIPVEIVPGITSPIAVPGAAGIPVTHRTVAAGFAVVTGHEDPTKPGRQIDVGELAGFPGTLCFLMGVQNLAELVGELRTHGRASDTPVAVIQWGTTARQRTVTGTLETIVSEVDAAGLGSPSVIVVGDVVRLAPGIAYRETRPLHGLSVLVPRTLERPSVLAGHIRHRGGEVVTLPVARTVEGDHDAVRALVQQIVDGEVVSIGCTSTLAVQSLRRALDELSTDSRALAGVHVAVVGRSVGRACREVLAIEPDAVHRQLQDASGADGTVWLLRDDESTTARYIVASRTERVQLDEPQRRAAESVDLVAVGSSTVVEHLEGVIDHDAAHVSMGSATTTALHAAGRRVVEEATEPSAHAMVEALERAAVTARRSSPLAR